MKPAIRFINEILAEIPQHVRSRRLRIPAIVEEKDFELIYTDGVLDCYQNGIPRKEYVRAEFLFWLFVEYNGGIFATVS